MCKWCEGDCKDMEDHCNKAKIKHYYDTHKKEITWSDEYIAPEESFGAWIEIKMVEYEPGLYHEDWHFKKVIPSIEIVTEIMEVLENTLSILTEEDYGFSTPYIIEIDHKGQCHLLAANMWKIDKIVSMDIILRPGKLEWVKTTG